MSEKLKLDDIDLKILSFLMQDAQMSYTEIAKHVFVSGGTVHVRMKKMQQMKVVIGSELRIDFTKLGYDIKAFLGIFLEKSAFYNDVIRQLKQIPEIVSVDYTTGNYSMFALMYCKDTNHLRDVLHDKIQKVQGIERTETIISLSEDIKRPPGLLNQ